MTKHNAALNHARQLEHTNAVDKATRESTGTTTLIAGSQNNELTFTDPADAKQLRGIPALTQGGIGSHIAGTRPDTLAWVAGDKPRTKPRRRL